MNSSDADLFDDHHLEAELAQLSIPGRIKALRWKNQYFEEKLILKLLVKSCDELSEMRRDGIVPRDIQPANFYVLDGDRIELIAPNDGGRATGLYSETHTFKDDGEYISQLGGVLFAMCTRRVVSPSKVEAENKATISAFYNQGLRNLIVNMLSVTASERPTVEVIRSTEVVKRFLCQQELDRRNKGGKLN